MIGDHPGRIPGTGSLPSWVAVLGQRPPRAVNGGTSLLSGADERTRKLWLICDDDSRPAVVEGDSCAVIFSGHLHDRARLAAATSAASDPTGGDAELVLRTYLRIGESGLHELRGAFVVLVWDGAADKLLALRDPLGYRPLFFARKDDAVLLSMSQDALLRQDRITREVDRAAAAAFVCGRWLHEPFFAQISRLLPGHSLRASGNGIEIDRYWRPFIPDRPQPADEQAIHDKFDLLLSSAVDRCLDIGPAAVFLSGGIDSTLIAAAATTRSRERGLPEPLVLSLGLSDPESDESDTQRAVASALGIPQILVSIDEAAGPEGLVLQSLEAAAWMALPPTTPWISALHGLARKAVELDYRVILSGEGSEWFTHDWVFAADLLRRLDLGGLYALGRMERRYSGRSRRWVLRTLLWRSGIRALLREAVATSLVAHGGEAVLRRLRRRRDGRGVPFWVAPEPEVRRELVERWGSTPTPVLGGAFHVRARRELLELPEMGMSSDYLHEQSKRLGAEFSDPFEDPELIDFLLALPPEPLVSEGRAKSIAQAAIRRRLPTFDTALLRSASFEKAFESLLAGQGERALQRLGGLPALAELGIVDPKPLARLLRGHADGAPIPYTGIWYALSLEAWFQARL